MAFIFKPVVTKQRADGSKARRRSRNYWASYRDPETGEDRRVALRLPSGEPVTARDVAESELRRLLNRQERKAAGLIDLAVESAGTPVRRVMAGYARHLRGQRRTPKHIRLSLVRIKDVCRRGDIERLADLNEPSVSKALRSLAATGRSPKTLNDIRAAVYGLCKWAVKIGKLLTTNPLEVLPKTDIDGDVRKVRRALTPDEAARLLDASGPRRLWYEVAMYTGLRVGEIQALRWADLDLGSDLPCIMLRAETTKARRADSVPLRRELADKLAAARPEDAEPTDRVFRAAPKRETFTRDCVRAGIMALDSNGSQIPDARGRTIDRHSLRTTFITWLSRAGVSPRTAQLLARHTDIRLTMKAYTDPALLDAQGGIDALPDLPTLDGDTRQVASATGTYGKQDTTGAVVLPVVLNGREAAGNGENKTDKVGCESAVNSRQFNQLHADSQPIQTGGGGNRTRVPEHFGKGLYVHSRSIESRPGRRRSTGFAKVQLDSCLVEPRPSSAVQPAC